MRPFAIARRPECFDGTIGTATLYLKKGALSDRSRYGEKPFTKRMGILMKTMRYRPISSFG